MKFRCPYCRHEFGPEPSTTCPACSKAMRIPDSLKPAADRKPRHRRSREDRAASGGGAALPFARKPTTTLLVLGGMALMGVLLLSRTSVTVKQAAARHDPFLTADGELEALVTAVERFRRDCGRYPLGGEGLKALVINPGVTTWRGPYVNLVRPDPWRQPYVYRASATNVLVFSCGPDRAAGTADDILPPIVAAEAVNGP